MRFFVYRLLYAASSPFVSSISFYSTWTVLTTTMASYLSRPALKVGPDREKPFSAFKAGVDQSLDVHVF